jgi:hypothetical protein
VVTCGQTMSPGWALPAESAKVDLATKGHAVDRGDADKAGHGPVSSRKGHRGNSRTKGRESESPATAQPGFS